MLRIIEYPAVVRGHLDCCKDLFSQPQLRHFAEYLTGLMVCDKATIKGINNSFMGHREYSNKDRFMTKASWPEREVDRRRVELIKEHTGSLNPAKGYLAIDDTICEKTGKHIEGVGKYYDHAKGCYVLGHNLVTSQYITPRGCFPIGFQLYRKKDKAGEAFKTKIELAQELVAHALSMGLRFGTVVFDAWFLSKDFVRFLKSKQLHWVSKAKSDRIIFVGGRRMNLDAFRLTVPGSAFKRIEIDGNIFYCFTKAVTMSKLGKVRLVISHEKSDLSDDPTYMVTDDCRWEARRILKIYQSRWSIETFYRDSKQNLGLEAYEMRDLVGIKRHWYLVFLSYTLLTLSSMDRSPCRWINANVRTIGEKCRWAASEIIRNFTLWVLKQNSLNKTSDEILTLVFSSQAELGRRFQMA